MKCTALLFLFMWDIYTGSHLERANRSKKTARCRRVLVVTKLFDITVDDMDKHWASLRPYNQPCNQGTYYFFAIHGD